MTLTAALCHSGLLVAISDTLTTVETAAKPAPGAFLLPTGPRLFSSERGNTSGEHRDPARLVQKMLLLQPGFLLMWAGRYSAAITFIEQMKMYFDDNGYTATAVSEFFSVYSRSELAEVHFTALVIEGGVVTACSYGVEKDFPRRSISGTALSMANGSGRRTFLREARSYLSILEDLPSVEGIVGFAIVTVAALIAREGDTGEASKENFGAAYEIAYLGDGRFQKLDRVMYVRVSVVLGKDNMQLHVTSIVYTKYLDGDFLIAALQPSSLPGDGEMVPLYYAALPPGETRSARDGHNDWDPIFVSFSLEVVRAQRAVGRHFIVRGTQADGESPIVVSHPYLAKSMRVTIHKDCLREIFDLAATYRV